MRVRDSNHDLDTSARGNPSMIVRCGCRGCFGRGAHEACVFEQSWLLQFSHRSIAHALRLKNEARDHSHPPPKSPTPHLRHDRIAEENAATRQALERIPLALLTSSDRLEAARNVQRIASLGSDQTRADSLFIRKFTSVAHELATVAFSPVSGVDDK
jgi:hypothetical protein